MPAENDRVKVIAPDVSPLYATSVTISPCGISYTEPN